MLGRYYDARLEPRFYSIVFFTVFMIPIVPLGVYLVSTNGGAYFFHAAVRVRDFNALYRHGYVKLLLNGIAETILVLGAALAVLAVVTGLIVLSRR